MYFYNKILKKSFWSIIASFIGQGLNFATIFLIAKNIGPKYFGIFNLVQITIGTLVTFSTFGLVMSAIKLVSENILINLEETNKILSSIFSISIIFSFALVFFLFVFSNYISLYFFNNLDLGFYFKISALIILFDSIYNINNGILFALEAFKETAIINLITGSVTSVILIISSFNFDIQFLFFSILVTKFFNVFVCSLFLRKIFLLNNLYFKFKIFRSNLKSILKISFPSFLSSLTSNPISWISSSLLSKQNEGFFNLGVYNFYNQFRTIVLFFPDSAGKVTFPELINLYSNRSYRKYNKLVILTIMINLILSLIPSFVIFISSKYIFDYLNIDFQYDNFLLFLILLNAILVSLNNSFGYIIVSSNFIWIDFLFRIITGCIFLTLVYQFGRFHAAVGLAKCVLYSNIFYLFSQIIFLFIIKYKLNNE